MVPAGPKLNEGRIMNKMATHKTFAIPAGRLSPVICLVLLLIVPITASAQRSPQDVQDILDQTDEVLMRVREIVKETDSEQARRILMDAEHRQAQARELHAHGNGQFAIQMSKKARDAARQAERIARTANSYEGQALERMGRLQETYDDLKQRAHDSENEMAMRFVREAEQAFRRAREQYRQTRYDASLMLLKTVETHLQRAARILFESGDADRLARELDNTADLLDRASGAMGESTDRALVDMLERARRSLDEARNALTDGDPMHALRLGRRVREQAQRILRQANSNPDTTSIRALITRFDSRQAELADRVQGSGDEQAAANLRKARDLRDQAETALENGNPGLALRSIRSALGLQKRAGERSI